MGKQSIYCSISNCHYWSQGNLCKAGSILVTSDTMAKNLAATVDAPYAAQVTQTPVGKNYESCCKTFVLKGSFDQNVDSVIKQR